MGELGFRLTSAKLIDPATARWEGEKLVFKSLHAGRKFEKGKGVTEDTKWRAGHNAADVETVLRLFFYRSAQVLRRFRVVLDKMLALFEAQTEFQFIGMSLFVCYDADLLAR